MSSKRIVEVDYLRGLAMFAIIFLHTSVYFLTNNIMKNLWNFGHFAVPLFIFCSVYLFFVKEQKFNFQYLKKRFWRLLYPYYIFAIFFIVAVFIREPNKINFNYIKDSILTTGGVDLSWLVLLFLQLTFIIPLVAFLWKKSKILFGVFTLISLLSSILLIFFKWPYDYKLVMWLPYSLVIIYTMFFVSYLGKKWFYVWSLIISGFIFTFLFFLLKNSHLTLNLFDNKYPPNLYYLSYGILAIGIIYLLAKRGFFAILGVKNLLLFLSKYSYSVFFIHYLLLYIFVGLMRIFQFNFLTFFLSIFSLSLISQITLNKFKTFIVNH